jgi:hypothetical protein
VNLRNFKAKTKQISWLYSRSANFIVIELTGLSCTQDSQQPNKEPVWIEDLYNSKVAYDFIQVTATLLTVIYVKTEIFQARKALEFNRIELIPYFKLAHGWFSEFILFILNAEFIWFSYWLQIFILNCNNTLFPDFFHAKRRTETVCCTWIYTLKCNGKKHVTATVVDFWS